MNSITAEIGRRGEEAACEYLEENNYTILHRNWRSGRYEIDIIAVKDDILHILEVKTRKINGLTTPEDAITPKKFRALSRAAEDYINLYGLNVDVQFDLIAVEYDYGQIKIRYVPNAMIQCW